MKWVLRILATFGALIIIGMIVLLAMGQRANAGRIHVSADIGAAPAQLWPWLNEGEKLKQWVSWLVEVRGWDHPGVGSSRVWVMKNENQGGQLVEVLGKCVEYTPPARLTVQLSSAGTFEGQQAYRLEDLGNGRTRLEVNGNYHFSFWFIRLMEPLITSAAEKKLVADVAHLKSLLESDAARTAAR